MRKHAKCVGVKDRGIDIGKCFLNLGFEPAAKLPSVGNNAAGVAALVEAFAPRGAFRVAIEAIGPAPGLLP